MRVRSYIRVSSEEQREQGTIATQEHEIPAYYGRQDVPIDQTYRDDGVSGSIPFEHRPAGREAWEAAQRGEYDTLAVWKFDRLGRDTLDILRTITELRKLGVQVQSVTQPSTDDPNGQLQREILAAFASFERSTIRERTRTASRRLAAGGTWLGGIVPYGYRKSGNGKDARLEVSTGTIPGQSLTEVQVVKRVFQSIARGESGMKVAASLNEISVPPRYRIDGRQVQSQATAGVWSPGMIRNMVNNETYRGVLHYGKRTTYRGPDHKMKFRAAPREQWITRPCPAIVSDDLWQRANEALKKNRVVANARYHYLLRGKIFCGVCGMRFIGTMADESGKRFFYKCNGRHSKQGPYFTQHGKRCPAPTMRGQDLDRAIMNDLRRYLKRPGAVIKQLDANMAAQNNRRRWADEIGKLESTLAAHDAARLDVLEGVAYKRFSERECERMLQKIEAKRKATEEELQALRRLHADADARTRQLRTASEYLAKLREVLPDPLRKPNAKSDLSFETWRKLVESLVESIEVKPGVTVPEVNVTYRFEPHFQRYVGREWCEANYYSVSRASTSRESSRATSPS